MTWRLLIGLALGLQLAACSLIPDRSPPPPPPPPPVKPQASGPTASPPPTRRPPSRTPAAKVPTPAPTPTLAQPSANPEELMGLDEDAVRKLLGQPAEARAEGTAKILSYHASDCALDVILFMDVKAGGLRVLSYQFGGAQDRPTMAKACYSEFRGK